ncbi:MAG: hypothetical protein R6U61_02800 [Thermoplasmata archaeon]
MLINMGESEDRKYDTGDQIHFIVTKGFCDEANEFASFCEENSINLSTAIRTAMVEWMESKKKGDEVGSAEKDTVVKSLTRRYERDVMKEVVR